jgi:predicted transposase YbfD/YdcC
MIGCGDNNDIARQLIELHQQERDHALDLAGFVRVATLFPDRVEFVEEQDAAIVCVERKVFTRIVSSGLWDRSTETAFYVSNTTLSAVNAADAIRGHWKIETTSHYSRDVTFGEDKSRIRSNPGVFARLRSLAFNILKSSKTSTLCQDRYRAALAGIDSLLEVLASP